MILIDDTEASVEFFNSTEHCFRLIFAGSVFSPGLSDKFISQKNDRFRCILQVRIEISDYKSCEERFMKFVVIANPTDLIISYFEVFVCFFLYFFYKMLKYCSLLSKNEAGDIDKRDFIKFVYFKVQKIL